MSFKAPYKTNNDSYSVATSTSVYKPPVKAMDRFSSTNNHNHPNNKQQYVSMLDPFVKRPRPVFVTPFKCNVDTTTPTTITTATVLDENHIFSSKSPINEEFSTTRYTIPYVNKSTNISSSTITPAALQQNNPAVRRHLNSIPNTIQSHPSTTTTATTRVTATTATSNLSKASSLRYLNNNTRSDEEGR